MTTEIRIIRSSKSCHQVDKGHRGELITEARGPPALEAYRSEGGSVSGGLGPRNDGFLGAGGT